MFASHLLTFQSVPRYIHRVLPRLPMTAFKESVGPKALCWLWCSPAGTLFLEFLSFKTLASCESAEEKDRSDMKY